MKKLLLLNKPVGATPLETIEEFRGRNPEYKDVKLAYAGRLDPMAEGLLLVLVGDECKRRDDYQKLDKVYEFEVLFGVSTDTYDILGKITNIDMVHKIDIEENVRKITPDFIGEIDQPYPPYSAALVNGKPLYWWARVNRLDEIEIPSRQIQIYDLKMKNIKTISSDGLKEFISGRIDKVKGDFRQSEIKKDWDTFYKKYMDQSFTTASFIVHCSSGTYVRSIAYELGQKLGIVVIALSIRRISIDRFKITV